MTKRLGVFLLSLLLPAAAHAQTCTIADNWQQCYFKITGEQAAIQLGDVDEAVAKTNTGKPDLSTISNTTLRDFLSFFTAAVGTQAVGEREGAITLDYNLPIQILNTGDVIKLQGIFSKPEIDPQLKESLGTNADAITSLNDSFDEVDDVTVSAVYRPQTARFGRQLARNSHVFDALMFARGIRAGPAPSREQLLAQAADALIGVPDSVTRSNNPTPFADIGAGAAAAVAKFERAIRAAKPARAANRELIAQYAELINGQEQVYFAATFRNRDSRAGANSVSFKATWEVGGKNLSRFVAANRGVCSDQQLVLEVDARTQKAKSDACLTSFEAYVATPDRGLRWAFTVDVQRTESNAIVLPQYNINLNSDHADTQIVSASVGKRFDPPTSSRERRIDFTGSYENVDGDSNMDDRLVASLTYTQELSDTFTLPITLTFANKEKFLTDEHGDRLGVHFAIAYKLPKM